MYFRLIECKLYATHYTHEPCGTQVCKSQTVLTGSNLFFAWVLLYLACDDAIAVTAIIATAIVVFNFHFQHRWFRLSQHVDFSFLLSLSLLLSSSLCFSFAVLLSAFAIIGIQTHRYTLDYFIVCYIIDWSLSLVGVLPFNDYLNFSVGSTTYLTIFQ